MIRDLEIGRNWSSEMWSRVKGQLEYRDRSCLIFAVFGVLFVWLVYHAGYVDVNSGNGITGVVAAGSK
ncbi:MAG: hypothetical protein ACLR6J_14225 [Parabacteroides merdae]